MQQTHYGMNVSETKQVAICHSFLSLLICLHHSLALLATLTYPFACSLAHGKVAMYKRASCFNIDRFIPSWNIAIIRCVLASLSEGVSVHPYVRPYVTHYFWFLKKCVYTPCKGHACAPVCVCIRATRTHLFFVYQTC